MPRIYVGRLSQRCTERDLERFFDGYGKIRDVMMKAGYAFIDFNDHRDADDAVHDLNGKDLLGERVIIEHATGVERGVGGYPQRGGGSRRDRDYGYRDPRDRHRGESGYGNFPASVALRKQRARDKYGPPIRTKWQLRIENLSSRVSWQDLKDYSRPYGEVTYADAHRKEKGVAVLCLASYEDFKNVMRKMDGMEFNGKKISIVDDREDNSKSRSRSRTRSRSPRKYRSRSRSKTRSRSKSCSRHSRSKSKSKSKSKSPSRSKSPKSPSRSRSRSRSRSHKKSSSKSRSRSRSRSKS